MGCAQKRIGLQENMIQKLTYESIVDAAMHLDPSERCRVASRLWESIGEPVSELDGDDLEEMLNQREAEIKEDPSQEISHEDFIGSFAHRRQS
jgi:putative addiction module component (TIGR02574 family)